MNAADLAFLKRNVPLLADFSDAHREELAHGSHVETYEPGATIMSAGDEVHFLGVVLEGMVAASVTTADGGSLRLGEARAGETFGEMALMSGDPLLVDLTAETSCRIMLVPLTLFRTRIMTDPRALQHISRTIGERLQHVMSD